MNESKQVDEQIDNASLVADDTVLDDEPDDDVLVDDGQPYPEDVDFDDEEVDDDEPTDVMMGTDA